MQKFNLLQEEHLILLDDTKFNLSEITNLILTEFKPSGNNLNLECKNCLIKKYFKQTSVQGIFNQVEWKFLLRKGINCEIFTLGNNSWQTGRLQIQVILEFSRNQVKVSLSFCPDEPQFKETSLYTPPELSFNRIYHEQTPSYSHAVS